MGLDPNTLPDAVIEKMDPKDRPKGRLTASEAGKKEIQRLERDEQRDFAQWLSLRLCRGELLYDWTRTDKPHTGMVGLPDFRVYFHGPTTLFFEFKAKGAKLDRQQNIIRQMIEQYGFEYYLVYTASEAIELAKMAIANAKYAKEGK